MATKAEMEGTKATTTSPYLVRAFNPAHPDLANAAGVPAKLANEAYVESLARIVYYWGYPAVDAFGRTDAWEVMKKSGPGATLGLFPGAPKNRMGYLDHYMPPAQRKVVTPNNDTIYGVGFADLADEAVLVHDEDASWFYEAVGAGPSMAPKRPGPSSAYLGAYKDKAGEWLDGCRSYRLRVPPDPPIKLFWSVTLYDVDTRALILNEQKIADRSSRMDLRKNADGSVDIYCGPKGPAGFEQNWIPTVPGKNWFAYFRFYQPTEAYFDRSWPLPDCEEMVQP